MSGPEAKEETLLVKTASPGQTLLLGQVLGKMLSTYLVVALLGDLGTGKTLLVKGIAKGLGVEDEGDVTSPSFVLINEYRGRMPVWHIDLYRLQDSGEVEGLGFEELIFGEGVTLIEWAEKVSDLLPKERMDVHIEWVSKEERMFLFAGKGKIAEGLVKRLGEQWIKEE